MKSFIKLTWMESKLFLREPVNAFFTLIFPLVMLFIFGSIFNNQSSATTNGAGAIDVLIPSLTAMIIGMVGIMAVTITMATYRENGILRRLSATPVKALVVMSAQVVVVLVMTALGMLLLILAAKLFYNVPIKGSIINFLGGLILSSLSIFGIGFVLAGSMPTARTAQTVAMILLYPMLILSGAAWPRAMMPASVQRISSFIPLTYAVNLLNGLWVGESWGAHIIDASVLMGILLLGVFISIKTFRWE